MVNIPTLCISQKPEQSLSQRHNNTPTNFLRVFQASSSEGPGSNFLFIPATFLRGGEESKRNPMVQKIRGRLGIVRELKL